MSAGPYAPPRTGRTRPRWVSAAVLTLGFTALLWVLEGFDYAAGGELDSLGIVPRSESGLAGVLFAPLLHAGFAHLEANTVPVLVLGFLTLLSGVARGIAVTAVIWLVGGFGVWLFAPSYTVTLGASILIFGWLVYLMVRGFFTHNVKEIVLGVVLLVLYGGILWGVLPGQPGVSWQGHLFGALGGGIAAAWIGRRDDRDLALR